MNTFFSQLELGTVMRYQLKQEELKLDGIHQYSKKCPDNSKGDYILKLLKGLEGDS